MRLLTNPDKTAFVDLDELAAQLDQTTPYYVPWMIAEIRRLRALLDRFGDLEDRYVQAHTLLAELEGRLEQLDSDNPPRCPRCGSYQWIYQGDRQVCADCGT